MKKIAALFDCDGTLYSAQYGQGLLKYFSENRRKKFVRLYYAAVLPVYVLRKIKLVSKETYHRTIISRLALMVKGQAEHEFYQAAGWTNQNFLLPTERHPVVARLRQHQAQGHLVVLVSAQFLPSLKLLGEHYHADGLVGTKLEAKNGRYTGWIVPPVMIGAEKDRGTRQFFTENGFEVDWGASYAYADSITDTSLFKLVGHPVAVSPDPDLLALAQRNGWEVMHALSEGEM